jgi:hypothetical protein
VFAGEANSRAFGGRTVPLRGGDHRNCVEHATRHVTKGPPIQPADHRWNQGRGVLGPKKVGPERWLTAREQVGNSDQTMSEIEA